MFADFSFILNLKINIRKDFVMKFNSILVIDLQTFIRRHYQFDIECLGLH